MNLKCHNLNIFMISREYKIILLKYQIIVIDRLYMNYLPKSCLLIHVKSVYSLKNPI
jgi:hypothetical protein